MSNIDKNSIKILKERGVQIKFFVGLPGSGKEEVCSKLEKEYGFTYFNIEVLIENEVQSNNTFSSQIKKCLDDHVEVADELQLSILIRYLVNSQKKYFLVSNFPKTLNQALIIEEELCEIGCLIHFNLPKTIFDQKPTNLSRDIEYDLYNTKTLPMIDFYNQFGLVREVDCSKNFNSVLTSAKEEILPEIYCIIGKKYSGKTTVSNVFNEQMNFELIDFSKFLNLPEITRKKQDDQYVIIELINRLRQSNSRRVMIENFPQNENQYKIFISNAKKIKNIFYLKTEDYICSERMIAFGKDNENYIGSSKLREEIDRFNSFNAAIFLGKVPSLIREFEMNNYFKIDIRNFMNQIKPKILMIGNDQECLDLKNRIVDHYIQKEGFKIVNVSLFFIILGK